MTKDWRGRDLLCTCGSSNLVWVEDHEHDATQCQRFKCKACGLPLHVHRERELPDPAFSGLLYSEHGEDGPPQ